MDVLCKMLCYCPAVRCSAVDAGRHELFQQPVPSQEFDIVTKLSYETLAAVVRDAAQAGEPVTQQSLRIAMSMQQSQPPPSDVQLLNEKLNGGEGNSQPENALCGGNCGSALCRRNQHTKTMPICQVCHNIGRRCADCSCERTGCPYARLKQWEGRWCRSCSYTSTKLTENQYANCNGTFSYRKEWSAALRLTARLAFGLTLPQDVQACIFLGEGRKVDCIGPCMYDRGQCDQVADRCI